MRVKKNVNSRGERGIFTNPLWNRNSEWVGVGENEKTFRGGYGYFLELHISSNLDLG